MCVTRSGRVVSASKGRGRVDFFDGRTLDDVDLSVVNARKGMFVEVFGNLALSVISASEARSKRKVWEEVGRAATQAQVEAL